MSNGDGYGHRCGRNGEFCVTVGPVTRTAGILTQSVKDDSYYLPESNYHLRKGVHKASEINSTEKSQFSSVASRAK